jgi:catechol 2,3-dioxygenase-like lactoylglutathione lyase family enzyme
MIDHIVLPVKTDEASKAFFLGSLKPLGYELVMEFEGESGGFGVAGKPDLWLVKKADSWPPIHVAFHSPDRATVDAFYSAALDAGGRDNGAPGLRPHYHATYYAAFVLDPDGNNVEAVCHSPE